MPTVVDVVVATVVDVVDGTTVVVVATVVDVVDGTTVVVVATVDVVVLAAVVDVVDGNVVDSTTDVVDVVDAWRSCRAAGGVAERADLGQQLGVLVRLLIIEVGEDVLDRHTGLHLEVEERLRRHGAAGRAVVRG
ncbi:MAG: hypothetical protein R2749_04965 [Acidimicrobiales bacterium]